MSCRTFPVTQILNTLNIKTNVFGSRFPFYPLKPNSSVTSHSLTPPSPWLPPYSFCTVYGSGISYCFVIFQTRFLEPSPSPCLSLVLELNWSFVTSTNKEAGLPLSTLYFTFHFTSNLLLWSLLICFQILNSEKILLSNIYKFVDWELVAMNLGGDLLSKTD